MDEKKRQILELLTAAFTTYPEMRAGQLIANLFVEDKYNDPIFYMTDEDFIKSLKKYLKGESHG